MGSGSTLCRPCRWRSAWARAWDEGAPSGICQGVCLQWGHHRGLETIVSMTPLAAADSWVRRVFAFDGDAARSRRRVSLALIGVGLITVLPIGLLVPAGERWDSFRLAGIGLGIVEFALLWAVRRPPEWLWGVIVGLDVVALACNGIGLRTAAAFLIGAPFVGTLWVAAYMPTRTAVAGVGGYIAAMAVAL